jgi:hypothetical protein
MLSSLEDGGWRAMRRERSVEMENGAEDPEQSNSWFEVIGDRGFSFLGSILGLLLALTILLATAPHPRARSSERKRERDTKAEKDETVEADPQSPTRQPNGTIRQ